MSEHFCSTCHWWLKETHDKIVCLKQNAQFWKQYLEIQQVEEIIKEETSVKLDSGEAEEDEEVDEVNDVANVADVTDVEIDDEDSAGIADGDPDVAQQEAEGFKIEYLDADMCSDYEQAQDLEILEEAFDDLGDPYIEDTTNNNNGNEHEESETVTVLDENTSETIVDDTNNRSLNIEGDESTGRTYWNRRDMTAICDLCGQELRRKHCLVKHFKQRHQLLRHYTCESCPRVFHTK